VIILKIQIATMNKVLIYLCLISSLTFSTGKNYSYNKKVEFGLIISGASVKKLSKSDSSANITNNSQNLSEQKTNDSLYKIEIVKEPEQNGWLEFIRIILATTLGGVIVYWVSYTTQKKTILKENFERNLFSLLDNQDKILIEIKYKTTRYFNFGPTEEVIANGRDFFNLLRRFMVYLYIYLMKEIKDDTILDDSLNYYFIDKNKIHELYKKSFIRNNANTQSINEKVALEVYNFVFEIFYDIYDHYLRHFYRILVFIENEEKNIKNFGSVKFYTDMVQSRMSISELFIVFYNGLKYETAG